jgi:CHAD domain-containing protein
MLAYEDGAHSGVDIEDIHKMRVATRRMRSLIRMNEAAFKQKVLHPHKRDLKHLANTLGRIRDLDVQLLNLRIYQQDRETPEPDSLQTIIEVMEQRRERAHKQLVKLLDSKTYRQFVKQFGDLLSKPGKGIKKVSAAVQEPYQLRHVLPVLIHEHLARVRAYDSLMSDVDESDLHALRIECKRLRYLLTAFESVLGSPAKAFIDHLKAMQEHLGIINDTAVSRQFFTTMLEEIELNQAAQQAIESYITSIDQKHEHFIETFGPTWTQFNTRRVQRQLSDALLVLL